MRFALYLFIFLMIPFTAVNEPYPFPPKGNPPPGGFWPSSYPWLGAGESSSGFCEYQKGHGGTGEFLWPIDSTNIVTNISFTAAHPAIDIKSFRGQPVYAADNGVIVWAGYSVVGGGLMVIISHGNGWESRYGHLDSVSVACGQYVRLGSIVGRSGSTGGIDEVMLHFEITHNHFDVNPLSLLSRSCFYVFTTRPFLC